MRRWFIEESEYLKEEWRLRVGDSVADRSPGTTIGRRKADLARRFDHVLRGPVDFLANIERDHLAGALALPKHA